MAFTSSCRAADKTICSAMACAANFAFVNRQMITHWTRETFEQVFEVGERILRLELVYDVCHNTAKIETHEVDGRSMRSVVSGFSSTEMLDIIKKFIVPKN